MTDRTFGVNPLKNPANPSFLSRSRITNIPPFFDSKF